MSGSKAKLINLGLSYSAERVTIKNRRCPRQRKTISEQERAVHSKYINKRELEEKCPFLCPVCSDCWCLPSRAQSCTQIVTCPADCMQKINALLRGQLFSTQNGGIYLARECGWEPGLETKTCCWERLKDK